MRFMRRITAAWRFFQRPRVFDSTLVAVLAIGASIGLYSTWRDGYPDVAKGAGLFLLCTFPLLLRRSRPIAVAAIDTVADALGMATDVLIRRSCSSTSPSNGLDPDGILWIRTFMRKLAAEGRTVFVSSHLMSEMAQTADHLVVIGKGALTPTRACRSSSGAARRRTYGCARRGWPRWPS
ncbi:hypothetical protein [Nonomuraea sp. NEAU-A123]|uniref:hypothetical protein n=1 Tax=Nonomuraea sp. NEAU-A123 TaxID=2839649 RepID=UPI002032CC91|nr:hypothetical protein [Nonomuraea sp. NEAU-A123]